MVLDGCVLAAMDFQHNIIINYKEDPVISTLCLLFGKSAPEGKPPSVRLSCWVIQGFLAKMSDKGLSYEAVAAACKDGDPITKVRRLNFYIHRQQHTHLNT